MSLREELVPSEGDSNLTTGRERWQAQNLDDTARELLCRDSKAFLRQALSTPCLNGITGASGSWIEDVQGRKYLDFHGNSVHHVGYGHPKVVEAIKSQLDQLPFCPRRYTNEP